MSAGSIYASEVRWSTDEFSLDLADGFVVSMTASDGREYLSTGQASPLLSVRIDGRFYAPCGMKWDPNLEILVLLYDLSGTEAFVKVREKPTHVTFELIEIQSIADVELVLWGPFATTIGETIGDVVGVVRDSQYAMGIQALNIKTLGGYPATEDDIEPSYDIFSTDSFVDISEEDRTKDNYRGDTARATAFGSVLQAYTRNRGKSRIIENWGHTHYVAPPCEDGGVIGSSIALFGCPVGNALTRLGEIEIAEGLPHPMLDGVWGKLSHDATQSYLIVNFGEDDLDDSLELTKKAGLRYLYSDDPFETWGHFKLRPEKFPEGRLSLKRCVERAEAVGVRLGVHTLSNFITTNDPYVSPVPDERLAEVGSSALSEAVGFADTALVVEEPTYFNQFKNNTLRTVRIGTELVEYETVSAKSPWTLLNCKRGAFGTTAAAHSKGSRIAKLMDHAYKVFLSNSALSVEISERIAELFNETGLRQISFDGLEGNWSTGLGQYGRTLFTKTWFDALTPTIRDHVISDASNPGHFFWHIYTRMNWGEPWYAGFRESQTQLRLVNQRFFRRNLMPAMLGWFSMKPFTSVEDIEWLLARSAGFDAGFCLVTNPEIVSANGDGNLILNAIREWERARHAGAFSEEQKERLQKLENEFRLTPVTSDKWSLVQVSSPKFTLASTRTSFWVSNPYSVQPLQFILQVPEGSAVSHFCMQVFGMEPVVLDLPSGVGWVRYSGESGAKLFDVNWQPLGVIPVVGPVLLAGEQSVSVAFEGVGPLKVEFRIFGHSEEVCGIGLPTTD